MFDDASSMTKRIKILMWGASGVGKTTLALAFPKPAMIDLEGGADLYGDNFKFGVERINGADEIKKAVEHLKFEKHDFCTLVFDPITVYWEAVQKKWNDIYLERKKGSASHHNEYYDLQPRDWALIKAEYNELLGDIISLDMNVIVTAREKTQYKDNAFMVSAGVTFDAEKHTDYHFDTVLRLFFAEGGERMVEVRKDRSNQLPRKAFPCDYKLLVEAFGADTLERKPVPVVLSNKAQQDKLKTLIKGAGITKSVLKERLKLYGANYLHELSETNAAIIIKKLEASKEKK